MSKYTIKYCEGYYTYEPERIYTVAIALEPWDGVEDAEDESIYYYMDNEPLEVGTNLSDHFIITSIETDEVTA